MLTEYIWRFEVHNAQNVSQEPLDWIVQYFAREVPVGFTSRSYRWNEDVANIIIIQTIIEDHWICFDSLGIEYLLFFIK